MTLQRRLAWFVVVVLAGCSGMDTRQSAATSGDTDPTTSNYDGFFDLEYRESDGTMRLAIDNFDQPFIYQSSLARGVGSNDIGLDRGQLGATRLVRFHRVGNRVLMLQDNLDYRALSEDDDERLAVEESFARSVVWGFEIVEELRGEVVVDATGFLLRDAHDLAGRLEQRGEGSYRVDADRSAIYLPRTRAFPDNTEVEAIVTFSGEAAGSHLSTVVPDVSSLTVHMHHSFIRLPEAGYEPLPYDPRAGVIGLGYGRRGFIDYASPIGDDMWVNYGRRHRLQKRDPEAAVSDAVTPIVYYVDRGAPEPIRSALIEGASWWNQAFEAAGYRNAFQVRLLPDGADPMDVRYNVIQWVHRSTRGWSYGSSVLDPRTGEILKGHVTLGSLRVRQDYMIAEGLLAPYSGEAVPETMLDMSLARIRQLSAHEVGHTLGFEHNFAASAQDRASVMDYPVPLVRFAPDGTLDLSQAYDAGIGPWDVRTVLYAYQDFPDDVDASAARADILRETVDSGFKYVADADSRSVGSAHPDGNLWDNGSDAIAELDHLLAVREYALGRFSEENIRYGAPDATLEEVLVPIYLLHRFQLHAVGKLVGGLYFDYSMRDDIDDGPVPVTRERQQQAIDRLIGTLRPEVLRLPPDLAGRIPPRPPGFPKSREAFSGKTGVAFDELAPAAAATALTLEVLLHPERAARMERQRTPSFGELVDDLLGATWFDSASRGGRVNALSQQTRLIVLDELLRLAVDDTADPAVRGVALSAIDRIHDFSSADSDDGAGWQRVARYRIDRMRADPASVSRLPEVNVPPGSPIGSSAY